MCHRSWVLIVDRWFKHKRLSVGKARVDAVMIDCKTASLQRKRLRQASICSWMILIGSMFYQPCSRSATIIWGPRDINCCRIQRASRSTKRGRNMLWKSSVNWSLGVTRLKLTEICAAISSLRRCQSRGYASLIRWTLGDIIVETRVLHCGHVFSNLS